MEGETEEEVAYRAARRAVEDTFVRLGIDFNDPLEAQKDFAAMREWREFLRDPEFQRDLDHLRRWRKAVNEAERKGVFALIGFIFLAGGLGAVIWVRTKLGV